jgi:hypothetical protein
MTTDIETAQNLLAGLERQLAETRSRLSKATLELNRQGYLADRGDRKAAFAQGGLNKQIDADGRLALSIQREIGEAKKRIGYAQAQAAAMARHAQAVANAGLEKARLFEVRTPDNRVVRHWGFSPVTLGAALLENYKVVSEVHGAAPDGSGGFSVALGSSIEEFLAAQRAA